LKHRGIRKGRELANRGFRASESAAPLKRIDRQK